MAERMVPDVGQGFIPCRLAEPGGGGQNPGGAPPDPPALRRRLVERHSEAEQQTGKVFLVGAGPGDPGLITLRGLEVLRRAQVVIYDRLVSERLAVEAPPEAERVYVGKTAGHHTLSQPEINALLVAKAREGKLVVRLKGGDPFIFGRGGEEIEALAEARVPFEVVPGVTSAIAAPAYAGIPITHRDFAASFAVVTGREGPAKPDSTIAWDKLATGAATLLCLMGAGNLSSIVEQLVRHGRSPETPVALIQWGTWRRQRTLVGTLADIADQAREANLGPPIVAVVGDVVRLREKLRWFDNRPLFGKRVLVTRTREQAGDLSRLLAEVGAEPVEVPTIRTQPPECWEPVDEAISRLAEYGWVVFTSGNGVRSFFDRLDALGKDARALGRSRVAAIGPATAGALREAGIRADLVPEEYVAEAVAARLIEQGAAGSRILLARAAEAREVMAEMLAKEGARVDQVAVYRTVPAPEAGHRLKGLLEGKGVDAATFASSSSVRNLVAALGEEAREHLDRLLVACIGPITARTARELGLRVDIVASEYTIPGLVRALEDYYSRCADFVSAATEKDTPS